MARDDDDDDRPDEPVSKRRKSTRDDDEEDDDRPRKKAARVEEDDDEERPRKKKPADDSKDDRLAKPSPAFSGALLGAIIGSLLWGGMVLHSSCTASSSSLLMVIQLREAQQNLRGLNQNFMVEGQGMRYTMLGAQVVMFALSALLVTGGAALLARKGLGKYMAMGAPAGMVLVELAAFVICLILTKGVFLAGHNIGFGVTILFSLIVGGLNVFLLMNKDVSKVLR